MAAKEPPFRPLGKPNRDIFAHVVPENRKTLVDDLDSMATVPTANMTSDDFYHRPSRIPEDCFLILYHNRPGARGFLVELEMTMFPPSTDKNNWFQLVAVDWSDGDWVVINFPNRLREAAEVIALKWKLLLTIHGAIPHSVSFENGREVVDRFPIAAAPNVYTMQSANGASPLLDMGFLSFDRQIRERWANSLPLHGVRVMDIDDPSAQGTKSCNVCHKVFAPGDVVMHIGDDPTRHLSTDVCLSHLDPKTAGRKPHA